MENMEHYYPRNSIIKENATLIFEFTFKVKEKYAELFRRADKAVSPIGYGVDDAKVLQKLIAGINFDTMKINKNAFDFDFICMETKESKRIKKAIKKRLKGKKDGLENIFEKKADVRFCESKSCEVMYMNGIRCWNTLGVSSLLNEIEVLERSDGIYCRAVLEYKVFYRNIFNEMGKFIGTFGDTSSDIEVCYLGVELDDFDMLSNNEPVLLEVQRTSGNNITIKKLKQTVEDIEKKEVNLPEEATMKFQDISKVYNVSATIEVKPELYQVVQGVKEILHIAMEEKLINSYDKLIQELELLSCDTDVYKRFMESLVENIDVYSLREYEREKILSKTKNALLRSVLFEEECAGINIMDYVYMPSKIIELFENDFYIEEGTAEAKVTWKFNADVSTYTEEQIKQYFEQFRDNSISIDVAVRETVN